VSLARKGSLNVQMGRLIRGAVVQGLLLLFRRGFRRARLEEPGGALVHRELVLTGCIALFTTYSPILSPISVPTRVEKR